MQLLYVNIVTVLLCTGLAMHSYCWPTALSTVVPLQPDISTIHWLLFLFTKETQFFACSFFVLFKNQCCCTRRVHWLLSQCNNYFCASLIGRECEVVVCSLTSTATKLDVYTLVPQEQLSIWLSCSLLLQVILFLHVSDYLLTLQQRTRDHKKINKVILTS